jgi:hypothetical protein
MMRLCAILAFAFVLFSATPSHASTCDADATQASGSIYRICMPSGTDAPYNGMLVVWAHGFQDAGTPVGIPEDQLCVNDFCIPEVINSLGFAFATNSYRKTGMAILEGKDDLLDLVNIYQTTKSKPTKVYLTGASEGGLITALSIEQHSDVYSAGVAACGPIGDFPSQINYFGDARATFEFFFPGLIPGGVFSPDLNQIGDWLTFYTANVEPVVFDPQNRSKLDQWVKVAHLPYDTDNYLNTVDISVRDVLRYSVVNLADATTTIGGFPFDNSKRLYTGSATDLKLNLLVTRATADPAAIANMKANYNTTGILTRPLITLHTLRDQQVPYWHEQLYALKTIASGSFLTRELPLAIDRFEHCNFTGQEVLTSFAIMLLYDGLIPDLTGINVSSTQQQISTALAAKLPRH